MTRATFGLAFVAVMAMGGVKYAQEQRGHSDTHAFVNDMAIAGMAEVQLGKLAAERADNADVKAFGQMMVTDHTKANEELKQAASQAGMQLPTQIDQKHRDLATRLGMLKGAEFDREYMNAMVKGHEEVLGKLRTRAGSQTSGASPSQTNRTATPQTDGKNAAGAASQSSGARTGSSASGEQAITQWAVKTMPAVEQHLARAKQLQPKVAK